MTTPVDVPDALVRRAAEIYRDLHEHPELSMQEHRTAEVVASVLTACGCVVRRVAGTGVVGWLDNGPGPTVAFRADMDALPVTEETGLAYASVERGRTPEGDEVDVMHACGHDMHTACGLGIAQQLAARRDTWRGTAVFVFQPAEETGQGAAAMVADGLWDIAPRPEAIFAQHVSGARAGLVGIASGPFMSISETWRVTVHGRGGHAARPDAALDPVLMAAHMVVRLQSVVTHEVDPQQISVLTVAMFHAGVKANVIPDTAELTINMRHYDDAVRDRVAAAVRRVLSAEAAAAGAPEPTVEEVVRFPLSVNDPELTEVVHDVLVHELGPDAVVRDGAGLGGEDFGTLATSIGVPSVYWHLGSLSAEQTAPGRRRPGLHTGAYAPDATPTLHAGIRAGAAVLLNRLSV